MIANTFEKGPEGWCSYDYHASVIADGRNIFVLAAWQGEGGANNGGCVWTDHRQWSADTPEDPVSILPLIFYRGWLGEGPVDLRNAEVSVYLRGDDLELDGAQCFFWVLASPGTRWHCTSVPLTVTEGGWAAEPSRLTLVTDESRWHPSWSKDPERPTALADVLARVESYGFSFAGFSREVRGRLSMSALQIRPAG